MLVAATRVFLGEHGVDVNVLCRGGSDFGFASTVAEILGEDFFALPVNKGWVSPCAGFSTDFGGLLRSGICRGAVGCGDALFKMVSILVPMDLIDVSSFP